MRHSVGVVVTDIVSEPSLRRVVVGTLFLHYQEIEKDDREGQILLFPFSRLYSSSVPGFPVSRLT